VSISDAAKEVLDDPDAAAQRATMKIVGSDSSGIPGASQVSNIVKISKYVYDSITPEADTIYAVATDPNKFVTKIDTTLTTPGGTDSSSMGIYFADGYDVTINWGDGAVTTHSGFTGRIDHTYSSPGQYVIEIEDNGSSGIAIQLSNRDDRDKLKYLTIEQWGDLRLIVEAFFGAASITAINATDDLKPTLDISRAFRDLSSLTSWEAIDQIDWSGVASGVSVFENLTSISFSENKSLNYPLYSTFAAVFNNTDGMFSETGAVTLQSKTIPNYFQGFINLGSVINVEFNRWVVSLDWSVDTYANVFFSGTELLTSTYESVLAKCVSSEFQNKVLDFGNTVRTTAAQSYIDELILRGWVGEDASGAWS
jgi:hypothetical protein